MIRPSDIPGAAGAALWSRPAVAPARQDTRDGSGWFAASLQGARISGDLNPGARGLSVEQHAARVLSHLCADADAAA